VDFIDSNSFRTLSQTLRQIDFAAIRRPSHKGWVFPDKTDKILPVMTMVVNVTMVTIMASGICRNNRSSQHDERENTKQNATNLHVNLPPHQPFLSSK
jgi:hypothetical protein